MLAGGGFGTGAELWLLLVHQYAYVALCIGRIVLQVKGVLWVTSCPLHVTLAYLPVSERRRLLGRSIMFSAAVHIDIEYEFGCRSKLSLI